MMSRMAAKGSRAPSTATSSTVVNTPGVGVFQTAINNERVPDKRVRQAMMYGTDRKALLDAVLLGQGELVYQHDHRSGVGGLRRPQHVRLRSGKGEGAAGRGGLGRQPDARADLVEGISSRSSWPRRSSSSRWPRSASRSSLRRWNRRPMSTRWSTIPTSTWPGSAAARTGSIRTSPRTTT